MTNIDDLINRKLDTAACAEMALAKGDEMTDELKQCPFCKRKGEINDIPQTVVDGRNCGCWADNIFLTKDEWQSRPIEDALNARIAERDALIEKLIEVGNAPVEYVRQFAGHTWKGALVTSSHDWQTLVAEWQKMKGEQ